MNIIAKQLTVCCALLAAVTGARAQTFFSVAGGASLYVQPGADISFDSLVLSPSADVLLTGTDITKSTELVHTATGEHINRVYRFSQPVAGFSGTVSFGYMDNERNGLDENTLVLNAYTNGSWNAFGDGVSRDADYNYVTTTGVSNISLDELTLTSADGVLPLQWISLEATRGNAASLISWTTAQEVNCKYYQVQKSTDTRSWQNVGSPVAARNSTRGFNSYSLTDTAFLSGTAFYRIMLTDINGRGSYSAIVRVTDALQNLVTVYPNPATSIIHVSVVGNATMKQVKVFDASGKLLMVKAGSSNVYSFDISSLANGFYMMTIETNAGKISKGYVKQ